MKYVLFPAAKGGRLRKRAKNHVKRPRPSSHSLLTLPSSSRESLLCRNTLQYAAKTGSLLPNPHDNPEIIFLR